MARIFPSASTCENSLTYSDADRSDVGPTDNTTLSFATADQSVSGKTLCVALSSDGTRAYVGGHSGVWRSDDGGNTWWHPEWPEPPAGSFDVTGALRSLNVYDVAIQSVEQ